MLIKFWSHRFQNILRFISQNKVAELDPYDAYQLWAETFDHVETNALLFAEQSVIQPMLEKLPLNGKSVLDAGCGTGRYLRILQEFRPRFLAAFDFSPNMLQKAQSKIRNKLPVHLEVADLEYLPFKNETFDLVLCTLALDHLKSLGSGASELSRVLQKNGRTIISVFHPYGQLLGWQRTFKTNNGQEQLYAVKYYHYSHSDYFNAFRSAGFAVEEVNEPHIDETLRPFYEKAGRLDLYERYKGFPLLLIFHLVKQ